MEEESKLEELKKDYLEIQKEYSLPEFDELNEDFQIEKLSEMETDFLVREIRKFMSEKFSNYLRFVETLLNPSNAPMFVFSLIKSLNLDEKHKLNSIYKKLAKKEVEIVSLDLVFDEQKEVEFVKDSYVLWQEIKSDLLEIVEIIKNNWDVKFEQTTKGYFG